uniref:Trigger factor-like protein TIGic n=1 Tax=Rhizophora mucronata TaxID=61149 RepID=A0A2P2LTV5_RHIMU
MNHILNFNTSPHARLGTRMDHILNSQHISSCESPLLLCWNHEQFKE